MTITVKRGGLTANYWSGRGNNVRLKHKEGSGDVPSHVQIRFIMASKGGGDTEVQVEIDADSFDDLAKAMASTSREQAAKSFGAALAEAFK